MFSIYSNSQFGNLTAMEDSSTTHMNEIQNLEKGVTIDSLKIKNRYELQILAIRNGYSENIVNILSKEGLIDLLSPSVNNSSQIFRKQIWDTYIGKEIGEYSCLLCDSRQITQLDFKYGYNMDISRGGQESINNILPICHMCFSYKGTKSIEEYLRLIGKNRLPLLTEKIHLLYNNCIILDHHLKLYDHGYMARYIATNQMLWNQFTCLMENNLYNKKIKIGLYYKQIVLQI